MLVVVVVRDIPDLHKYTMGLHGVNDNKAATVLRDLNHEAYHYHGVAPQPAQIDLRLGHLEQPLTETKWHALVCAHYIKAFSKSQVYKQVCSIYKAPALCVYRELQNYESRQHSSEDSQEKASSAANLSGGSCDG